MNQSIELREDFIGIYDGFIPDDWCQRYIRFFESQKSLNQTHERADAFKKTEMADESCAESLFGVPIDQGSNVTFSSLFFEQIFPSYFKQYPGLECVSERYFIPSTKVQKTLPGQGYHVWHCEHADLHPQRVLAWTLYLNDDFEGGETEFLHQSYRAQPKKGRVCVFPAHFTHMHRGNPPLSGVKYIQTGWVCSSS